MNYCQFNNLQYEAVLGGRLIKKVQKTHRMRVPLLEYKGTLKFLSK